MNRNPYDSNEIAPAPERQTSPLRGAMIKLLILGGILVALVVLLLPMSRRGVRPAVWRMQSMNNLKQIGICLLEYESKHGALPPAFTTNESGEKLHSWRTLILPCFEDGQRVYEKIDLTKPWDADENAEAREESFGFYQRQDIGLAPGETTYFGIVGENYCLHPTQVRAFAEIIDGIDQTIVVYEGTSETSVHWMNPNDPMLPNNLGSIQELPHPEGTPVLLVDGSVHFLDASTPASDVAALKTIAGGEEVTLE